MKSTKTLKRGTKKMSDISEIEKFLAEKSAANGAIALTRGERDRLFEMIKGLDEEREVAFENLNTALDERNEYNSMLNCVIEDLLDPCKKCCLEDCVGVGDSLVCSLKEEIIKNYREELKKRITQQG